MIRRRALAASIRTKIGNHTFRATGITAYLKNGGRIEVAQQMAAHESARTTGLYDRRGDEVTMEEVRELRFEEIYGGTDQRRIAGAYCRAGAPGGQKKNAGALSFKVSDKGAVSVYGMGRFPVTLYYEQWLRLLGAADELLAFLEENKSKLKLKEEA